MYITVIIIFIKIVAGQATTLPYTITPLNTTGVIFEEVGELWTYSNVWSIFTEIDLQELDTQILAAEMTERAVNKLCPKTAPCKIHQQYVHMALANIKRRTHIIKEINPKHRPRRSLFNGIGNIFHYLFGVMDNNNEEEIYSKLKTFEANEETLIELEKHQISVVNATLHQIQQPLTELKQKQDQIDKQIKDILYINEKIAKTQYRQEMLSTLTLQIMEIEARQQTLLDVITATQTNQIHPLLIAPSTLSEIYQKTNPTCQECLPIIYQTAEIKFHILKDRLVVRVILPVLNLPKMQYYQIRCYPIHHFNKPSTYLDIPYTHVAMQPHTQNVILFKDTESRMVTTINQGRNTTTLITKLNAPFIRAHATKECVIKLLFNPLNEEVQCPIKVQIPPQDTVIQMSHKNSWLYSIKTALKLQITCTQRVIAPQIQGQGILSIEQPCQIQIGDKILQYQGIPQQNITIIQPNNFPLTNITSQLLNLTQIMPLITPATNNEKLHIVMGEDTNNLISKSMRDLNELQQELDQINKPTHHQRLSNISLSLTSCIIIIFMIYALVKIVKCKKCSKTAHPHSQQTNFPKQTNPPKQTTLELTPIIQPSKHITIETSPKKKKSPQPPQWEEIPLTTKSMQLVD